MLKKKSTRYSAYSRLHFELVAPAVAVAGPAAAFARVSRTRQYSPMYTTIAELLFEYDNAPASSSSTDSMRLPFSVSKKNSSVVPPARQMIGVSTSGPEPRSLASVMLASLSRITSMRCGGSCVLARNHTHAWRHSASVLKVCGSLMGVIKWVLFLAPSRCMRHSRSSSSLGRGGRGCRCEPTFLSNSCLLVAMAWWQALASC